MTAVWAYPGGIVIGSQNGAVSRRSDGGYEELAAGTDPSVRLRDVWFEGDDGWAVGPGGLMLRWNGAEWSVQPPLVTEKIDSVWGSSPGDVWASGGTPTLGFILHFDGGTWTEKPHTHGVTVVGGSGPDDVWALSTDVYFHFDGVRWTQSPAPISRWYSSLWAASSSDVWAVGQYGAVVHFDGGTWSDWSFMSSSNDLLEVTGTRADDVWAVSVGSAFHFDGTAWSAVAPPATPSGIWAAPGKLWLAAGSTLFSHDGGAWQRVDTGESFYQSRLRGDSSGRLKFISPSGILGGKPAP